MSAETSPLPKKEPMNKTQDKSYLKLYLKRKDKKAQLPKQPSIQARDTHTEAGSRAFSRHLFTDGFNSFSHFTLGAIAVYYQFLVPVCTLYQLLDPYDVNMYVDILEFVIGFTVGLVIKSLLV
jgi:hypothetical protein